MAKKRAKRSDRDAQLDALQKKDPALCLAMQELRKTNPQAYRKQLKRLAQGKRRPSTTALKKWGKSERKKIRAMARGKPLAEEPDTRSWGEVPTGKKVENQD